MLPGINVVILKSAKTREFLYFSVIGMAVAIWQIIESLPTDSNDLKMPVMRRAQLTRKIMFTYEKLSTEEYWNQSVKQELKAYRDQKNRDAIRSLFQFIFAAGMILFVMFAVETMPTWLPVATEYATNISEHVNGFTQSQTAVAATTTAATGS